MILFARTSAADAVNAAPGSSVSSIASAKGFRNIILLLTDLSTAEAARFVPAPDDARWKSLETIPKTDDGAKSAPKELWTLLETVAETEHLRWNAFHFMRGVRTWPIEEVTDAEAGTHRAKDIKNRARHAALVPYIELPAVNRRFGLEGEKTMEYNDRKIIEMLLKVRREWKELSEEEKSS